MQNVYMIRSLVDPSSTVAKAIAGGNSASAVFDNNTRFLRILSEFPAGSATVTMRFLYDPGSEAMKNRLKIFLIAKSNTKDQDSSLTLLLENGPLNQFYLLEKIEDMAALTWSNFNACCDITRKQTVFGATVTAGFNTMSMPYYYAIEALKPENSNNYMDLDNILDRLSSPVLIDVCVEPVETGTASIHLSECISRYQGINRTWEREDGDLYQFDRSSDGQNWSSALKPLKLSEFVVDELLRRLRRLNAALTQNHLKFSIRSFAADKATARLLGSVIAESGFTQGGYQIHDCCRGDDLFDYMIQNARDAKLVTPPVFDALENVKEIELYRNMSVLCSMSTVDEISCVFRLPAASAFRSPRCIRKDTDPDDLSTDDMIVIGTNESGVKTGIPLKNFVKHCSIFGLPGGGKSILSTSIISRLCMKNIPFILFEPGKSEYRRLKCLKNSKDKRARRLAGKLKLFTPGTGISPLSVNPLQIPGGISVYEHIENLLSCFKAAMPMEGPMVGILAESLELVYRDTRDVGHPPVITELHRAVKTVISSKTYSQEVKSNFDAAFDVRLGQLSRRSIGEVFKNRYACPGIKELLKGFSVIELAALPAEVASLLTLFILTMICEHVKSASYRGPGVRLAIILEEAHNLVGPDTNAMVNDANANPKAFAAELICRMLAELRSLGIAIIILDQLPSAVAPQVVKNTASKVVFRQVDLADRQTIGGAMLFDDVDMDQLARLVPGQAYFHTEGHYRPQIIVTQDLKKDWDIPDPPVGTRILPYIKDDKWFIENTTSRVMIQTLHFVEGLERLTSYRKSLITQAGELQSEFLQVETTDPEAVKTLSELVDRAEIIRTKLNNSMKVFERSYYEPYILFEKHRTLADKAARDYLKSQLCRYGKLRKLNQRYSKVLSNLINVINRTITTQYKENDHVKNIVNP